MAEEEDMSPEEIAKFQKENCIFCKIISGEIPSKKVYEDESFLGILDINPATEGHVLLLPKQHFQIMPQIPPELVGSIGGACAKVSGKLIKTFKCDGTNIFIANGAVAGQRAPHFMVHVIPRKEGDGVSLNPKLADIDDRLFSTIQGRLISSTHVPSHPKPSQTDEKQQALIAHNTQSETHKVEAESNQLQSKIDLPDKSPGEDETELEQEHRLKKERDAIRSEGKSSSKIATKSPAKKNSGVDFDKLSRLFDK